MGSYSGRSAAFLLQEEMTERKIEKCCGLVWLDENLMWVQLLAGPRAPESSVKVSSKSEALTRGEYIGGTEPVVVFFRIHS